MIYQNKYEVTYRYDKNPNEMTVFLWRSSVAEVEKFIHDNFPTMEIITIRNMYCRKNLLKE